MTLEEIDLEDSAESAGVIIDLMRRHSPQERADIIATLHRAFCEHCGKDQAAGDLCSCMDDD